MSRIARVVSGILRRRSIVAAISAVLVVIGLLAYGLSGDPGAKAQPAAAGTSTAGLLSPTPTLAASSSTPIPSATPGPATVAPTAIVAATTQAAPEVTAKQTKPASKPPTDPSPKPTSNNDPDCVGPFTNTAGVAHLSGQQVVVPVTVNIVDLTSSCPIAFVLYATPAGGGPRVEIGSLNTRISKTTTYTLTGDMSEDCGGVLSGTVDVGSATGLQNIYALMGPPPIGC